MYQRLTVIMSEAKDLSGEILRRSAPQNDIQGVTAFSTANNCAALYMSSLSNAKDLLLCRIAKQQSKFFVAEFALSKAEGSSE